MEHSAKETMKQKEWGEGGGQNLEKREVKAGGRAILEVLGTLCQL